MKVLITGADGFIGKNLCVHLAERKDIEVVCFTRSNDLTQLKSLIADVEFVFHLAGINRPKTHEEFKIGNTDLTLALCDAVLANIAQIPIVYASSTQAELDNPYGASKRNAENALLDLSRENGNPVYLFRLPNVFGKWAKPNYNSAVATFCYNVTHDLPIRINDPAVLVSLVYIDDLVEQFVAVMDGKLAGGPFIAAAPQYSMTVGDLAEQLHAFSDSRKTLITDAVGAGLTRALYATYVSYLSPDRFSYKVPKYSDPRGVFVEMLKTRDSGQFSFFTAHPGITRGGHYHHSKTEKFLVIRGKARFGFRHIGRGESFELYTSGETPEIVETVPGWTHDITNIGDDEMIVMLWANEIFDRARPDTYACPV